MTDDPGNLTIPDREPTHEIERVQSCGVLIAARGPDRRIIAVSANSADLVSAAPGELLGRTLADALGDDAAAALENLAARSQWPIARGEFAVDGRAVHASIHRSGDDVVIELEPRRAPTPGLSDAFHRAVAGLHGADTASALYQAAARGARALTGYDRALIYRFDSANNGEVVAEDRADGVTPHLGHRAPASDIPAQAGCAPALSPVRMIADVDRADAQLVSGAGEARPDVSRSLLRGASPAHRAYLRDLTAKASFSISIVCGGALWGAICCHDSAERWPGPELRHLGEAFAHVLGGLIFASEPSTERETSVELSGDLGALHGSQLAEAIIDTARIIILILDVDGRIVRFNPYMERISGYRLDEVIGARWFDKFLPEHEQRRIRGLFASAISGGRTVGNINPIVTRTGEERMIEWFDDHLRNSAGDVIGLVAIGQDVTERLALERELQHAYKMEAVGTLASGVAHDFNNLLMGVIGCADVVLSKVPHDSPARPFVDEIKQASLDGAALVGQLMEFSRKQDVRHAAFELNGAIAKSEMMLRHLLGEDVTLTVEFDPTRLVVAGDVAQLQQILMNLAANARHAMSVGGRLAIAVRRDEVTPAAARAFVDFEPGAYAVVTVTDSGAGMDPATRERIFEPFFTTKGEGGTGLGLATVYGILKQWGGHIHCDSTPGVGTAFTLHMPLTEDIVTEPAPASGEVTDTRRLITLLVEDERLVQLATRHYLEQAGHHVIEASDAEQAEAIAADHDGDIDLLITDVVLPGQGGSAAASRVSALRPGIAVIYMSAHSAEMLVAQGRIPDRTPVLRKPFSAYQLAKAVARALDAKPADAGESADADAAATGAARPVVLLVEDEPRSRAALVELLDEDGYEVVAAASAEEALDAAQDLTSPLAVITDLTLPGLGGAALVDQLRQRWPALTVMYASGLSAHDPEVVRVLAAQPGQYFEKPLDIDDLLDALTRVRSSPR